MRYIPFPFIDADYDNRFYTSASDVAGVYGYKTETTQAGAALEWDLTERHVRDLPNVNETPRFKLFASKTLEIVTGDVSVATDASGRGQGTLAQANLWLTVPFDPTFSVSFGPGLTWGDTDYTHTFFAVTNSEAAASDLPTFATHAGVADTHFNGLAEWVIFNHYRIGAAAYLAHLRGDAAISPITVRREQSTLTGWIAYRFK
jgi:MipA family protein